MQKDLIQHVVKSVFKGKQITSCRRRRPATSESQSMGILFSDANIPVEKFRKLEHRDLIGIAQRHKTIAATGKSDISSLHQPPQCSQIGGFHHFIRRQQLRQIGSGHMHICSSRSIGIDSVEPQQHFDSENNIGGKHRITSVKTTTGLRGQTTEKRLSSP